MAGRAERIGAWSWRVTEQAVAVRAKVRLLPEGDPSSATPPVNFGLNLDSAVIMLGAKDTSRNFYQPTTSAVAQPIAIVGNCIMNRCDPKSLISNDKALIDAVNALGGAARKP